METVAAISQAKVWNPFTKGVHGRDLAAEQLIPKHITAKWQHKCGELRALMIITCIHYMCIYTVLY